MELNETRLPRRAGPGRKFTNERFKDPDGGTWKEEPTLNFGTGERAHTYQQGPLSDKMHIQFIH
jgi:hypothetical protein